MSQTLFKKLEQFRNKEKLSVVALCRRLDTHSVNYYRWKKSQKIIGAYKKIIEDFLEKNGTSHTAVKSVSSSSCDIAVIGVGCFYPGASNVPQLWENILARRVQFRRMLDQRLPLREYYDEDPKAPEKTYLTKAAFLENFVFDWGKLRIPKKTVESTDIAHWLALDIALKTFEDAGYKLNEIPLQNTGVIVGNTLTGEQTRSQTLRLRWPYVQKVLNATLGHRGMSVEERTSIAVEMEQIYKSAFYPVTEDSLAGGLANTIAGRICNYLNLKGGGYIVDGACSSSLLAVATAADALKMGNMDLALAGGVDISLDPFEIVGFAKAGALAKDQMRVYDQKANGFLPGEGCGFVLLKRLKDAERDKNYVYGVLKGWGISSDGKGGIMEPSSSGQSFAIGRAYKDLPYKISDVDFVEGHGTGTTKGDRVELEGIATAIEKTIKAEDKNKRGCGVTSFKSIVGHTKVAAGIGGFIKAVLAVNQRILPPTASCTHPNDVFQDKAKNLFPIIQGRQLPQDQIARAGISSAGFGGINCHVTVESKDPPKEALKPKLDERALFVSQQETEVFVFTARSITYLEKIIQKFKEDLRNISIAEMADLAALLNKKVKNRLPIKVAIVTSSPERLYDALLSLQQELQNVQLGSGKIHRIKATDPLTMIVLSIGMGKSRVGFLYPGQGSQRLNMARTIVERNAWAQELFILTKLPLFESIYGATEKFLTKEDQQDHEKQLADTRLTQPAVVLSSLIWTEFLTKLGVESECNIGHSLGELTAFYKAGAFNKETLLKFAQLRGELMAARGRSSGSMVGLFCTKAKAEDLINKVSGNIVIANINNPNQIVVSGGQKEIEKIKELAKKQNIPAYQLNVSNAFHSSFMQEASEKIASAKILPDVFKTDKDKLYSCMSGGVLSGKVNVKEYFSKQVISPVDFVSVIESAAKDCDVMIEVGPGRVLTDLVKAINEKIVCLPVESAAGNDRDLNLVLAELFVRNVPIKFEELYKNRLIRTFVPASRKKFIENQCERPLKFNNQTIKGDYLPAAFKAKEDSDRFEEIIPGGLPETTGDDKTADLLIALTQEITGFDRASISLNLRLLDDLNLDSIKAAELIGKAARSLGVPGQIDPSQLSNNTLQQISDRLNELVVAAKAGAVKESVGDILKRYQDKPWVRNFVSDLKPEAVITKNVNQLKSLHHVVLLSEDNEPLTDSIAKEFKSTKAKIEKVFYSDKIGKAGSVDCLMAILPRTKASGDFNEDVLREIIRKARKMVDLSYINQMNKDAFVIMVQFDGGGIASSCAKAIVSTLYQERPELKVRVIDFDMQVPDKEIALRVIDELQTYERFNVVAYDSTLTRKVAYYDLSEPANYKKRDIVWSTKDVVLVTGGAKGITAQCALEFARTTKAQMVLVGRSPAPKDKKDETNEIIQTLKQFEAQHLKCSYYQCDVTQEKDVVKTVREIEKSVGKITGFIHGAGLNSLKRLKQSSTNEVLEESLPKVMGAVNVCKALANTPPKLIVGITSIIGVTGMEGSGWYGLANEILNAYLHHHSFVIPESSVIPAKAGIQKPQVITIAYSVWDEVGMGAKLGSVNRLAEKGIGAIPVTEGIKHFRQLVEYDPGVEQVIVAARIAGIATWKSPELKPNHFRFIEKVEYILPGIELIARVNLNKEDDSYLLDHNWKGSLLLPFVFGFEAMAQAVAYVLGIDKFDHIKAKDIDLQRPITVPQDSGTLIEIHAQVLDQEKSSTIRKVKVEIYSQESAYKEPHFKAIFEINSRHSEKFSHPERSEGSNIQKSTKTIDLDMQTDIYGPILFQGKMFQCIEQIHELYYDEKTKKGECLLTSVYNKSTGEFLKNSKKFNNRFLIGDPFFIDSVLQSMQIVVSQDACLPNYIEEICLENFFIKGMNKLLIQTKLQKLSEKELTGNASTRTKDAQGFVIKNCRLKVLDHFSEKPSANDLVDSTKRDQAIIEGKSKELAQQMGFTIPIVRYLYDSRLKMFSKQERHNFEIPLIQSTVCELLSRESITPKSVKIGWTKTGRPILLNKKLDKIKISLSHCDGSLVCVSGYGEQGCDIENIVKRSEEEWLFLLGTKKFLLQKSLVDLGFDLDLSGTVVWSALESFKKIFDKSDPDFELSDTYKNQVIFSSNQASVCCMSINLTRGNVKIFSCSINTLKEPIGNKFNIDVKYLRKIGFNENQLFGVNIDCSGPQKQLVLTQRFPVTFKTNQMLSRRVYFTNFFDWIGTIRENSVYPTFKDLVKLTESGEWGLVTNMTELKILGGIKCNDIVEAKIWGGDLEGDKNATTPMFFEWFRITDGGRRERVAVAKQKSTWVSIKKDHSVGIEKMPKFLGHYLDLMRPMTNEISHREICPEPYGNINLGNKVKSYIRGIAHEFKMEERVFSTTLENSNIVGNIYFANYPRWLGAVGDAFFYKLIPKYFVNVADKNEIVCLECNIYYLNDAFPFEDILVEMYLDEIYENGLILYFEFHRIKEGKKERKLAYAKQKIVFAHWSNEIEPDAIKIPEEVSNFIKIKDIN